VRKYTPIWEKIKRDGVCCIAAHKKLHRRIIRGVSKEKDEDTSYKFLLAEEGKVARLTCESRGNEVIFTLKLSLKYVTASIF